MAVVFVTLQQLWHECCGESKVRLAGIMHRWEEKYEYDATT